MGVSGVLNAFLAWRRFSVEEVSARTKLKSSAARALRTQIVEQYPTMEEHIDSLITKKSELQEAKG